MVEKSVPRYKLQNLIVEGKTSLVYRAEDSQLKRTVALKRAREELIREKPQYAAVFAREAVLLSNLEHPHILPIYDFGVWDQAPVLISRFISARDLGQIVMRGEKLLPDNIIVIARQIGLALDFCQNKGFAHRDIEPNNILVDADANTYLADFGLACEFDSPEYKQGVGEIKADGHWFTAPELLPHTPFHGLGQSCDQFSFGLTLYILLTGSLPLPPVPFGKYKGLDPQIRQCTAFRIACGEAIIPVSDLCDVPSSVNDVFRRMLAMAPEDRFPKSLEAAERLQQALRGVINQPVAGTIFVSYPHADKGYVKNLVSAMMQCGLKIWWDDLIMKGSNWDQEIEDALDRCDAMLVVNTENSAKSHNVRDEWNYWLYLEKPIVTLVFKGCRIPFRLQRRQHVSAEGKSFEMLAEELAEAFRKLLRTPDVPTYTVSPVPSPEEFSPDGSEDREEEKQGEENRPDDDFPQDFQPPKRKPSWNEDPFRSAREEPERRLPHESDTPEAQPASLMELTEVIFEAPDRMLYKLGGAAAYMPGSDILEMAKEGLAKYIEARGRIIAIDLGATTSVVAIPEARTDVGFFNVPECPGCSIVRDRLKRFLTPSVIAEDSRGEIIVGHSAKARAGLSPEPILFSQRWMGEEKSFQLARQGILQPFDVSAHLLRFIKAMAKEQIGKTVNEAVIAIPVWFTLNAKGLIEKAARVAGLRVAHFAFKPVAAALVHFRNDPRDQIRIMTYDLGGGTFEATILEKRNVAINAQSILAFDGNRFLGGDSFDRKLAFWLMGQLNTEGYEMSLKPDDPENKLIFTKLLVYAERAKIALSRQESCEINETETGITDRAGNPISICLSLTRVQFETLINEEIERTIHLARQALEKAKQAVAERSQAEAEQFELDEIVLVGGSSRIPCIAQRLEKEFGLVPRSIAPDLCVALGAALIARDRPKVGEEG